MLKMTIRPVLKNLKRKKSSNSRSVYYMKNPLDSDNSMRKPIILSSVLVVSLFLVCALHNHASAASSAMRKPITFGVESISGLRSQEFRPERAEPVVENDLIIVASSRKRIVAFDFQGQRRFITPIEFAPVSTPAVENGRMYVGGDDGKFHCLDMAKGTEIWDIDLKSLDFSRPALSTERVIFQTANDRILALDRDSGEWRWEYQHLRGEDLAVRGLGPPKLKDGFVYVGLSGGSVVAMEEGNGKLIWKTMDAFGEQFMDVDAPLEVDETCVYAVSVGGRVSALSRKTGKVFWRYSAGGMAGMALSGDTIFLATDDAELMALDKITGRPIWTTELDDRQNIRFIHLPTRPVVMDGRVITVSRSGRLMALEKTSGEITWTKHFYTDTTSPAISIPDLGFLFMDNKGIIRLYRL